MTRSAVGWLRKEGKGDLVDEVNGLLDAIENGLALKLQHRDDEGQPQPDPVVQNLVESVSPLKVVPRLLERADHALEDHLEQGPERLGREVGLHARRKRRSESVIG